MPAGEAYDVVVVRDPTMTVGAIMALSRDLARAMGGDLELGETGDSGTRFVILLPRPDQGA